MYLSIYLGVWEDDRKVWPGRCSKPDASDSQRSGIPGPCLHREPREWGWSRVAEGGQRTAGHTVWKGKTAQVNKQLVQHYERENSSGKRTAGHTVWKRKQLR